MPLRPSPEIEMSTSLEKLSGPARSDALSALGDSGRPKARPTKKGRPGGRPFSCLLARIPQKVNPMMNPSVNGAPFVEVLLS